jgi:hypothetical protein
MVLDRLTDLPYTEQRTAAIEEVSIEWNDTTNFVFAQVYPGYAKFNFAY